MIFWVGYDINWVGPAESTVGNHADFEFGIGWFASGKRWWITKHPLQSDMYWYNTLYSIYIILYMWYICNKVNIYDVFFCKVIRCHIRWGITPPFSGEISEALKLALLVGQIGWGSIIHLGKAKKNAIRRREINFTIVDLKGMGASIHSSGLEGQMSKDRCQNMTGWTRTGGWGWGAHRKAGWNKREPLPCMVPLPCMETSRKVCPTCAAISANCSCSIFGATCARNTWAHGSSTWTPNNGRRYYEKSGKTARRESNPRALAQGFEKVDSSCLCTFWSLDCQSKTVQ